MFLTAISKFVEFAMPQNDTSLDNSIYIIELVNEFHKPKLNETYNATISQKLFCFIYGEKIF